MAEKLFFHPHSLQEACERLAQYRGEASLLAGGTDLMVKINRRRLLPRALIFIGDCGLDEIRQADDQLFVGATSTFAQIVGSELVQRRAPLLAQAAGAIGSPAVRNAGTVGGNLANASRAADSVVALLALRARLRLVSLQGERVVDVEAFATGPGETILQPDELIAEVVVPAQPAGARWAFRKLGQRRANTCSIVSAAVLACLDGERCQDVQISLGAVAPTPFLARQAANSMLGQRPSAILIERAAEMAAGETSPEDDGRATAWYRRRASQALVTQLLGQIFDVDVENRIN